MAATRKPKVLMVKCHGYDYSSGGREAVYLNGRLLATSDRLPADFVLKCLAQRGVLELKREETARGVWSSRYATSGRFREWLEDVPPFEKDADVKEVTI